jgi:transporter family-2 protein
MSRNLLFLFATFGGVLVALQAVANSRLRVSFGGDAIAAALFSFGVGALTLGLTCGFFGDPRASFRVFTASLPALPWWALVGGVCGAGYVLSIIVGVPRVGVAWCMAGVVIGSRPAGCFSTPSVQAGANQFLSIFDASRALRRCWPVPG